MKMLMFCATVALSALGVSATDAKAEVMVNVDGVEYPLSVLTANCQSMSNDPTAMIGCFNALSALMDGTSGAQEETISPAQALDNLRSVAQYQDAETGLLIAGSDCNVQLVYYGNYFHISRRNVSSIDLFSARFDAANLKYEQVSQVSGGQLPLARAAMNASATATVSGGVALESVQHNFSPKSAKLSMSEYATQVVSELPPRNGQTFDFVLVHPERSQASNEIWDAFKVFVNACSSARPSWAPKTN